MTRKHAVLLVASLAAAVLLTVVGRRASLRQPWRASKVVLITIDTLRVHRLGCYGYRKRPTSPALDTWAREAVVFERATAQAPWTVPSMGSLFTGRYPVEVGVYTNQGAIGADFVTLPELFQRQGFTTASFNTHALLVNQTAGFRRGFDEVYPSSKLKPAKKNQHKVPFGQTEPYLMRWLEQHANERFFIWIHNMDPHRPATVDNPYLSQAEWKGYDGEVRWVDESIARIRAKLTALGIWDESLIIFAADHGEAFGEHKLLGHQDVMYDEVLHVPLIVQYPAALEAKRITEPVELLDLFPTIAELAGLPVPAGTRGESLVPLIEGTRQQRRKDLSFHARYHFEDQHHELAVRDREWKLLMRTPSEDPDPPKSSRARELRPPAWSLDGEETRVELYHVALDPGETKNRFGEQLETAQRLQRALAEWKKSAVPSKGPPPRLDEATQEALRALGYAK